MYRRIFLSQKTLTAAMVGAAVFGLTAAAAGGLSGEITAYLYFDLAAKLLLAVFLFKGYLKHNLLSMQAGCCGLLLSVVFSQGGHVFLDLFAHSISDYIIQGFWGCILLACELTIFILEVLITANHYYFYIGNRINFFRIAFNQTLIYILSAFILLQMTLKLSLFPGAAVSLYSCASVLFVLALFVLISCAELVIALDADERG